MTGNVGVYRTHLAVGFTEDDLLDPASASLGGVYYFAFRCLFVCPCLKYLTNIEPINFIFGGGLSSDTGRKAFGFGKNREGVMVSECVCVCGGGGVEILAYW